MISRPQVQGLVPARLAGLGIAARSLLHLAIVIAMIASVTGPARANPIWDIWDAISGPKSSPWLPDCEAYADEAEAAAVEYEKLQCGDPGARFSKNNWRGHQMWCMERASGRAEEVIKEANARSADLARCSTCDEYGKKANGQVHENALFHCGGGGPRWNSGEHHKKWCMSLRDPSATSGVETRAREQALKQCKANFTPAQLGKCTEYADQAVKQAKFNAEHKCGGTGERWSQNRDEHFAFCTFGWRNDIGGTDVVTAMKEESDAREAENFRCKPPFEDKVRDDVKSGAQNDPVRVFDPNEPIKASPGSAPFRPFDRNAPVVVSPGKSTMPPVATLPPSTTLPRVPPPAVPAVPRQPGSLPPVVSGTGSGGVVLSPRPVPSLPLPSGTSRIPSTDGMLEGWISRIPGGVFRPKAPGGTSNNNGGTGAGRVPPPQSPPLGQTPGQPNRPSGEPPANTGGGMGNGGIVSKPKLPTDAITTPGSSGRPSGNSDPRVVMKPRPIGSGLITSKPPAPPLDMPRLRSEPTKSAPPLMSKYRPVAPSLITAKPSSVTAPVKSGPVVRDSTTRPAMMQGKVNRLSIGQPPLRLR